MSSFASFVAGQVLSPRLRRTGVLIVYDPERRYRELCLGMAADTVCAVDAGGSSIESREAAMAAFRELGRPNSPTEGLLVYVPAKPPLCDEDRQRDPFALYATCGSVFPEGDDDEYLSLCLKAKPDLATEVRRVFAQDPSPSFETIDAIGGGSGWPTLQALLKVESARHILYALLAPSDAQKAAMAGQDAWIHEAKEFVQSCLGLKLMTRSNGTSAYSTAPPLEQLLIDHILTVRLRLIHAECVYTSKVVGQAVSLEVGIYWDRYLSTAHNRFLRAVDTLARVRRLARNTPALQINIAGEGGKQVNVQQGAAESRASAPATGAEARATP